MSVPSTTSGKWRERLAQAIRVLARPEITIAVIFAALLVVKVKLMLPAALGPIKFGIVQHDAPIVALLLLLYAGGSGATTWEWGANGKSSQVAVKMFGRACMAMFFLVLVVYAADVVAYKYFATRLYARDVVTFLGEPRGVLSFIHVACRAIFKLSAKRLAAGAVVILLVARTVYVLLARPVRPIIRARYPALAAATLAVVWFVPVPLYFYSYGDKPLYENVLERNANFFINNNFSNSFRAKVLSEPVPETRETGRNRKLNVIVLEVESLSAYQSNYFSGVEDWTPRLDEIAKRETSLPNFYANGWTSIGGMVSLLTGSFPLVPEHTEFNTWGSPRLTDFMEVPKPLPRELSEQGYFTEFFAAGDVTFLGQDRWLQAIGFQKIAGQDDPRFADQKLRGPFKSVPDREFYSVTEDELTRMPADKPYFLFLQTFWSHRPFTDANTGAPTSEESVVRETDAQIGAFYDALMASGFFQNGMLFITGDHRAMEPFRKAEFKRFGGSAIARIPAVIVTRAINLPHVIEPDFQQTDFRASIEALVTDRYYEGPEEGSFLSAPPTPSQCILHADGDDRDLVFVKCGNREGTVRASGDATRFISGSVPGEPLVIETINRTRARQKSASRTSLYASSLGIAYH